MPKAIACVAGRQTGHGKRQDQLQRFSVSDEVSEQTSRAPVSSLGPVADAKLFKGAVAGQQCAVRQFRGKHPFVAVGGYGHYFLVRLG